jgi:Flp pilus assembly pilin Flp
VDGAPCCFEASHATFMPKLPQPLRAGAARLRIEGGQTVVEYGLLAFVVAVATLAFLTAVGLDVAEVFDHMENALGIGDANLATTAPGVSDAAAAPRVH